MKIEISPDDVELRLRIGGGELSLMDVDSGVIIEVFLSESDMVYLKKRLGEWEVSEINDRVEKKTES